MYKLYYSPGLASLAPHFVLCEIGVDYELELVDRSSGKHKSPEYLALNPNGRIPTFSDGNFVLFESAAICLHLVDKHPESNLIAKAGSDNRAHTYQWLAFLTNTLQADLWQYYRPEFYVDQERQNEFRSTMEGHVGRHLTIIDDQLAGTNYLAGNQISVADFYLFMLARWSRNLSTPTRSYANLSRLMENMSGRASIQKAMAIEQLPVPFY
jgi:glutathione S-transferase